MHPHLLLYSSDPRITRSQLKKQKKLPLFSHLSPNAVENIQKEFYKLKVQGVIQGEKDFHFKFSTIKPLPYLMYYQGNYNLLNMPLLAIVGPRKISSYAEKVLHHLFQHIPKYKIAIISGGAKGTDQLAHNLALENNIPTIVALGMGIGNAIQGAKRNFLKKVVNQGGLLLSEYKLYDPSTPYSFPERNRIIAGLSDCVFIPEAQIQSGSLITADFAHKAHKPIYGTPNTIFQTHSSGLHQYIQSKRITPIFELDTMLSAHFSLHQNPKDFSKSKKLQLSPDEKSIIQQLSDSLETSLNTLVEQTQLSIPELLALLTKLELQDLIHQPQAGYYSLK